MRSIFRSRELTSTLGVLVVCGLILRSLGFGAITFGYDQARDALEATSIFTTDHLKLIGPGTDIKGIYHGIAYWYLIAPLYYLTSSPYVVKAFHIALNLMCIPLIYVVVFAMARRRVVAVFAALIFAFSPDAVLYARWLSNPSPAFITILLTGYALWLMWQRRVQGIVLFLIVWPLSVHFQLLLGYHIVPFVILFFARFRWTALRPHLRILGFALVGALGICVPFILAQVKLRFQFFTSLSTFFEKDPTWGRSREMVIGSALQLLSENIRYTLMLLDGYTSIAFILFVVGVFFVHRPYRQTYIAGLLWFLSPLLVLVFGHTHVYFYTIGNMYGIVIMTAVLLTRVWDMCEPQYVRKGLTGLLIGMIVIVNTLHIVRVAHEGEYLFSVQQRNTLETQRQLIDWIYTSAKGEPFAINTITNPILINTTWAYLFDSYGRSRYGYMPAWRGADQTGNFGDRVSYGSLDKQAGRKLFVIIEPEGGIPQEYVTGYRQYEDLRSRRIRTVQFDTFAVDEREMVNERGFDYNALFDLVKDLQKK